MNKAILAVKVVLYADEFIVRRQFIHKVIFSAAIIIKKNSNTSSGGEWALPAPIPSVLLILCASALLIYKYKLLLRGACLQSYKDFGKLGSAQTSSISWYW